MYRTYQLTGQEKFVISMWDGDCTSYTVCETEEEYNAEKERIALIDKLWEKEKADYKKFLESEENGND